MMNAQSQKHKHTPLANKPDFKTALKLSIFLGLFGVDRFYLGNTWLGISKLVFTLPILAGVPNGLLISIPWWLIDIFIIHRHQHDWSKWLSSREERSKTKKQARKLAKELALQQEIEAEEKIKKGICPVCGEKKLRTRSSSLDQFYGKKGLSRKCYNCGWDTLE